MPYIKEEQRGELDAGRVDGDGNVDGGRPPKSAGELNYAITRLITVFVEDWGLSYGTLNDVVGALECAKLELYRRVAAPYEDSKIRENGDVYPESLLVEQRR
jgi:hypothetical protein